ncbi:MAG: thiamine phosphate synthase [Burkholderiaceae bacterium]|nr:thiamine phosphate synthase [Burkholderiaceae bacterium]
MNRDLRFPAGLYGVTPDWHDAGQLEQSIRQAAAGGMTAIQLRLKNLSPEKRCSIARHLLPVCKNLQIPLIINDDWQLALDIGADGVHLGKDDADPAWVRSKLPATMLLGVSCYSDLARAQQMLTLDVDYIAFGSMFSSGTKPQAPQAATDILTRAQALTQAQEPRPAVVAIGGITTDNAPSLLAAGADSLAVVGGLFMTDDIEQTARRFSALWSNTKAH